jgi:glutaredoxin
MTNTDLKSLVRDDLKELKEQARLEAVKRNEKLKEITIYTKKDNLACKRLIDALKLGGIKYVEKDLDAGENINIMTTIQMNAAPIIYVNGEYLAQGRDFQNPGQLANILQRVAHPNYTPPAFEERMIEGLKTLNFNIGKSIQNLQRSLQPITKILSQLAEEDTKENA